MENTPEELLKASQEHGSYLQDIELDLGRKPLLCGFPTIEGYEYILSNRGNLVILAARAGEGKSALAAQLALNTSKHTKVLFFSLEMSKKAIAERLMSVVSQVPIKKLKNPIYAGQVKQAYDSLRTHKLKIIDTANLSINTLLSMVYDENRISPVGLVVIDYIQLLSADTSEKRHLDLSKISSVIKTKLADKLGIPVLVLAQMNQNIDSRLAEAARLKAMGKTLEIRPQRSDIGESKGIVDAADVVMFIRRPCLSDPDEPRSLFKVAVCKNRNGTTKDFDLEFSEELTYFVDRGSSI